MRGRCERHQLALGPSGCLICRREQAASPPPRRAASQCRCRQRRLRTRRPRPRRGGALAEAPAAPSAEPARTASATPTLEPPRLNIEISPWALLVPAAALALYLASAVRRGSSWSVRRATTAVLRQRRGAVEPVAELEAPAELTGEAPERPSRVEPRGLRRPRPEPEAARLLRATLGGSGRRERERPGAWANPAGRTRAPTRKRTRARRCHRLLHLLVPGLSRGARLPVGARHSLRRARRGKRLPRQIAAEAAQSARQHSHDRHRGSGAGRLQPHQDRTRHRPCGAPAAGSLGRPRHEAQLPGRARRAQRAPYLLRYSAIASSSSGVSSEGASLGARSSATIWSMLTIDSGVS